jgi:hypothetical protein
MREWGGAPTEHLLLAETLGLVMARRAADILERHRPSLVDEVPAGDLRPGARGSNGATGGASLDDDARFAADNAVFTAVLDAANECLGRFDNRPADERWCDALLQLIHLAQVARDVTDAD